MQSRDRLIVAIDRSSRDEVLRLADALPDTAGPLKIGLQAFVANRPACGRELALVVPGIRPEGSEAGDQRRTKTPAAAIAAGADYIVVGRPITDARDPRAAAAAIVDSLL